MSYKTDEKIIRNALGKPTYRDYDAASDLLDMTWEGSNDLTVSIYRWDDNIEVNWSHGDPGERTSTAKFGLNLAQAIGFVQGLMQANK